MAKLMNRLTKGRKAFRNNVTPIGRALRLVGGTALVGMSMTGDKRGAYRWAAGLAGLQMVWAGITGNDVVKNALGPRRRFGFST